MTSDAEHTMSEDDGRDFSLSRHTIARLEAEVEREMAHNSELHPRIRRSAHLAQYQRCSCRALAHEIAGRRALAVACRARAMYHLELACRGGPPDRPAVSASRPRGRIER